jgi:putative NIF3 family GTP cyclohydrolase 1 type 2
MNNLSPQSNSRRSFITQSLKAAGGLAVLGWAGRVTGNNPWPAAITVKQVIELILKEGNLNTFPGTVDTIKFGEGSQLVTGIITTMFPTITVIHEAIRRKANFIIAHEPSFYNHRDDRDWVKDNVVLQQKLDLLEKHGIVIWRFHDYCHSLKPDAVMYGVVKKAGWLPYFQTAQRTLTIPPVTVQQLALHLKSSLNIQHVRVIGNLQQVCRRVTLMPGAVGGQRQVSAVESEKPDVLVVGELSEWETAEYIRDANLLGIKRALIVLGHSVSEEPGMEYFVEWLQPKLPQVKITHIASNDPFTWL